MLEKFVSVLILSSIEQYTYFFFKINIKDSRKYLQTCKTYLKQTIEILKQYVKLAQSQ